MNGSKVLLDTDILSFYFKQSTKVVAESQKYLRRHKIFTISIGDADILIAATAIENNLAIVTNNESHFNRITNLQVINWNK